jgi:hypothetical protein
MKKNHTLIILVCIIAMCFSAACNKRTDYNNPDQLSLLPAPTQTGANTFGALVNGLALLPANSMFNGQPPYQCNYIYTNGGYYLVIDGSYKASAYSIVDIQLGTTKLAVHEGQTIKLENCSEAGKACGAYYIVLQDTYETKTNVNGQLYISKFDQVKQIVSGTFFLMLLTLRGTQLMLQTAVLT